LKYELEIKFGFEIKYYGLVGGSYSNIFQNMPLKKITPTHRISCSLMSLPQLERYVDTGNFHSSHVEFSTVLCFPMFPIFAGLKQSGMKNTSKVEAVWDEKDVEPEHRKIRSRKPFCLL
jgi:hypothetical protein